MFNAKTKKLIKKIIPKGLHEPLSTLARTRQPRNASLKPIIPAHSSASSPFEFAFARDNLLQELGAKYCPTKRLHNYLVYYWAHFRDIRHQVRSFLEIGLETDRSIRMWEEFFPNAEICGIDIDPKCKLFEGGRRRIFIGDQSDCDFLEELLMNVAYPFDVVIDDGSHYVKHQIESFNYLFPRMSSHGVYVVEDTGGCVEDFHLATVNALKSLVDSVMHWPRKFPARKWTELQAFGDEATWLDKNIVGVAFYRWMVVIMRGRNPQDNPFLGSKQR